MKSRIAFLLALLMIAQITVYGRGAVPPPPPFSGGSAGSWIPRGSVFGFDSGGGSDGGWGSGYYEGGGWGGWGFGSGGAGGYNGSGTGNTGGKTGWGDLLDTLNKGRKPSEYFGTCYQVNEVGNTNTCRCAYTYYLLLPPCSGCPIHGFCREAVLPTDESLGCEDYNEICTGYAP